MINYDEYTNENKKEHNLNWPYIPDHPYRKLMIGGSGTEKTNALLNLITNQQGIDKKDMLDVYKNSDNYNPERENKILIVFDYMIADMINNKKLNSIVNKLFVRCRKLNMSFVFISQSYFKVSKDLRNNSTHFFIMKLPNKRELQQIAINHSSDINTKYFINIYKKCTDKPYSFLVIDTAVPLNSPLRFRKSLNITNDDNK